MCDASRATSVPPRAHRHADVGALQRRRVVDAVAGHRDELALRLQRLDDADLLRRVDARVDAHVAAPARRAPRRRAARQLAPGHHGGRRRRAMPSRRAIARAVAGWSPVIITGVMPAAAAVGDRRRRPPRAADRSGRPGRGRRGRSRRLRRRRRPAAGPAPLATASTRRPSRRHPLGGLRQRRIRIDAASRAVSHRRRSAAAPPRARPWCRRRRQPPSRVQRGHALALGVERQFGAARRGALERSPCRSPRRRAASSSATSVGSPATRAVGCRDASLHSASAANSARPRRPPPVQAVAAPGRRPGRSRRASGSASACRSCPSRCR